MANQRLPIERRVPRGGFFQFEWSFLYPYKKLKRLQVAFQVQRVEMLLKYCNGCRSNEFLDNPINQNQKWQMR